MVRLSNAHIIIDQGIAGELFADASQVNWVFYPRQGTMMIALPTDEGFRSVHKTSTSLLKRRNEKGDRSLSVMEILIDHEMDDTNRELDFKADKDMKILSIFFGTGVTYNHS